LSRSAVSALVVIVFAMFPAVAHARAWEIQYQPNAPVAGEEVAFHAERVNPGNGGGEALMWDFGDGGTATGADVTHVFASEGQYTVTLSSPEVDGPPVVEDTVDITVAPDPSGPPPNTPPSASFTFTPASPLVGESVLFSGGSDPDGDAITRVWDFGDLTPTSSEAQPTHSYATDGSYTVSLTVTDDRGGFASTSQNLTVAPQPEQPPPDDTPPADTPPADTPSAGTPPPTGTTTPTTIGGTSTPAKPRPMRPFPVVRIAGVVLPDGARVRILSVRAPRGARVAVRCSGRDCPASSLARISATRLIRLHRFERRLRAGVKLELFVRKTNRIGKYTRFLIRAGKAPARVDRCLMPGRARPVRCP
jgi:PKD repeat protein